MASVSSYKPLAAARQRRRLGLALLACGVLLAVPVGYLLHRVYEQLRNEAFYRLQTAAIQTVARVNERVYEVLKPESERPFDHYGFWSVPQNKLLPEGTVNVSPLAELAPRTGVPGVIGYFQIDPDGRFRSPVVPERGTETADAAGRQDLGARLALRAKLQTLLSELTLVAGDRSGTGEPASIDAFGPGAAADRSAPAALGHLPQRSRPAAGEERREYQQLADLKLDDALYRQQALSKHNAPAEAATPPAGKDKGLSQSPRKETLSYLAESETAGQGRDDGQDKDERDRTSSADAKPARTAAAAPAMAAPEHTRIERFEGEIYPLELEILPSRDYAFYRKVWRDQRRYIQGFIADAQTFSAEIFAGAYQGSALRGQAAMIVSYHGEVLRHYGPAATEHGVLLYRAPLAFPLHDLELVFSATALPLASGAPLVHGLAVLLALLIPGVLYGVYRLGRSQIELAQQRSNFVSAVSHELKTPLTSIRMYSEILRAGWAQSEDQRREYYEYIFSESERLSRLIANVLQLAQVTNHDAALVLQPYTPKRLLDLVCSKVGAQIAAAGYTLELGAGPLPGPVQVLADEDAFSRIFINLVDNAIKFSRHAEDHRIEIGYRSEAPGPTITFYVRDYGPGIDRAGRKRLFQLFYRGEDELTRTTPGTGIGLALVKELADKMGAEVDLHSHAPGVELQIRFRFSSC
ncbi:MAG: sensor histidine kinase [Gammaproteobacteria bacterium]